MFLVLRALRRPVTVIVAALAIFLAAGLAVRNAPVDIFPDLRVPVIYVVQPYGGMSPSQMEGQLISYYEYHFLYIAGIEHIESYSIQGMGMLKLYFHPGTDIAQSMAQVTAMTFRATAFMPTGTLPAFIVRFDAGSIPVGQLVFSSDTRSDSEIQDLALYKVRPLLATLPGVSAPPPSGGKIRTIVVYADPARMRSYRISPDEIATTLARQNLTLPSGNVRVGDLTTIASMNALIAKPADLGDIPLRLGSGPTVFLRDVARVSDGADIVYNIALANGRRTVYMPLTKRADASTLDVVNAIKDALPRMRALIPNDIHVGLEFDQSIYVRNAIRNLVTEGALGAVLTSLVVLLFLRNWRSALIVVLTIPFSILAAVVGLRLAGQTLNIMTLGGLALAVGILVDEATVAIENIHTHLAGRGSSGRAVVDAMREVMLPRFLAMLVVISVFIPALFMVGIGRALFPPLALAVAFSMIASYVLSSTLVPVMSAWLFRRPDDRGRAHDGTSRFSGIQDLYERFVTATLDRRALVIVVYVLAAAALFVGLRFIRTELFPRVDAGQMQVRIRAPAGTRLERTEEIVRRVDRMIREEVGDGLVSTTLANVGNPPWNYPVNGVFVWNSGPQDALLLAALKPGNRAPIPVLEERLRKRLATEIPSVRFSFEPGDIVSQVLNFGSPTAISVTVSGNKLEDTRPFAEKLAAALRQLPMLRDVQIPQALDYPTLNISIDRERAGQLGVSVDQIGKSIVSATSSSELVTPNFWVNPGTGIPYRVSVQVPENQITSIEDLKNLPIMPGGAPRPLLGDVAQVVGGKTFGELDHLNSQRMISVTANIVGGNLARAATEVDRVIRQAGTPPRGTTVAIHGQAEQMEKTLASLKEGVALAIIVVLLLLTANFQSLRDALTVLSVVPAVLGGVLLMLLVTATSLNIESLMGTIMAIGVSVANALLLVTFARERRRIGDDALTAVRAAGRSRLRPIAMTGLAMIAGMIPMALGLGEGGDQSAPLGRAVIGGLLASTVATLVILPAVYTVLAGKRPFRSPSLHPDDTDRLEPEGAHS
jgi:multidrug efflux pump subunit AcrB